jgi:hypothetical protein
MGRAYDFTATVAPGASVTKGLIYLSAPSTADFRLIELEITMDGGATQFWPKFQWVQASGAFTAPTGGGAFTLAKANAEGYNLAAATTCKTGTFTAELAAGSGTLLTRRNEYILNQAGVYVQHPLDREPLYCPASNALYLQVITPASFANNIAINGSISEG